MTTAKIDFSPLTASIIFLIMLFAFPNRGVSRELAPNLQKIELGNGITAIVKESHRAPVAAVQVWVKAGSLYETDQEAGITHLIEHMIFKGTKKRGTGQVAREIEAIGGSINAYTSLDYTVYHCTVPAQYLEVAVDVLADAIFNSVFDKKELEREKKVVLEELRMREDRPQTRLSRLMMSTSYQVFPYKRPVIGYRETVSGFTRDDILRYMKRRYRPGNIAVVVAGDVEATRTMSLIQKSFGGKEGPAPQEPSLPEEPRQRQPRVNAEEVEIQEGYMALTFSGVCDFSSEDAPVLDVMAALLGEGDSSRLVRQLRDQTQLVHTIDAAAFTPRGPGLFEITASLPPGNVNSAVAQILQEVFRLQSEEVLPDELNRAKIKVETDFVYGQESMDGEARELGLFETMKSDPAAVQTYLQQVREVTPEQIKETARRYFHRENTNLSLVIPSGSEVSISSKELLIMAQEAELSAQGITPTGSEDLIHPVKRTTLSNGLTLLVQEAPEVPTVSLRIAFPGGVRYETQETNGLFNFMAQAWNKGTASHSAQGLAEAVDDLGGSLQGFSGQNTIGLQARFLSQNLDKALPLFAEVLMTPTFPGEELDKLRPRVIAQIKRQEDYLPSLAFREFRRLLFSPHPYGMNTLGTEENVSKFSSQDLREAMERYITPDRGVLSIVGDVDYHQVVSALETLLGGWSAGSQQTWPDLPRPAPLESPKVLTIDRDKEQVHIVLGFPGTTMDSPDRFPLDVLNAVLAGQGGRLFTELRDKESLAYSVTSINSPGLDYGAFAFYIACAPGKKKRAIKEMWAEINRIISAPVTDEELERAKKWLTGTYLIGLQTNGAKAMDMALNELYGLGFNFSSRYIQEINKVNATQVMEVAKRVLDPDAYVLVQAGATR